MNPDRCTRSARPRSVRDPPAVQESRRQTQSRSGVVSLRSVVTLRQNLAGVSGAGSASLVTTGQALVAVRDWTFLLGPGLMAGVNALLLGSLMYQSRLVPRVIPLMGPIGAPLLLASTTATSSASTNRSPCGRPSRPSPWLPGSCRSASGWSSRASGPHPSPRPARRRWERPQRCPSGEKAAWGAAQAGSCAGAGAALGTLPRGRSPAATSPAIPTTASEASASP